MSTQSDPSIQKLLQGDKVAFRRFYSRYYSKLVSWLATRVKNHDDAQEIAHDAFLSFLDSLPLFRGHSSLWTYLISIAKHEVADYWRKHYAKKAIHAVPFMDQLYTEPIYSSAQTAAAIHRAYQKLLPQDRLILIWKYEQDLSVKQIATRLGISLKAAESRLFRARQAFQLAYVAT